MARRKLSEFGKLRRKLFMSVDEAVEMFEVTKRTIRNWEYGNAPKMVIRMMQRQDRSLSGLHPAWEGFRIGWNGWLYGPNRLRVHPRSLRRSRLFFVDSEGDVTRGVVGSLRARDKRRM